MANGRVCTGFSKPYVGLYSVNTGGTITYTSTTPLARGVDVSIEPDTSSDDNFYADNQLAESAGGTFTGGTFTLTVDGLKSAAEKLIMGVSTDSGGWLAYDDDQAIPYVGVGFIARYMEGGSTSYVPYILTKCKFDMINTAVATSEDTVNFQTQSLSGKIFRGDDAKHTWRLTGTEYSTESSAESALTGKM